MTGLKAAKLNEGYQVRKAKVAPQGMTVQEAADERAAGGRIHACSRCIELGLAKCQWRIKYLVWVGGKLYCPEHLKEEKTRDVGLMEL